MNIIKKGKNNKVEIYVAYMGDREQEKNELLMFFWIHITYM